MNRKRKRPKFRKLRDIYAELDAQANQNQQEDEDLELRIQENQDQNHPEDQNREEDQNQQEDEDPELGIQEHQDQNHPEDQNHEEDQNRQENQDFLDFDLPYSDPLLIPNDDNPNTLDGGPSMGNFVFQFVLKAEDVNDRLEVPYGMGHNKFYLDTHSFNTGGADTGEILVRDPDEKIWGMTVSIKKDISVHITRGWSGYAEWHKLEEGDAIDFYKTGKDRFKIRHTESEKRTDTKPSEIFQEFKETNVLWRTKLTRDEDQLKVVYIPESALNILFTDSKILSQAQHKPIRVKLTDEKNKDWFLKIIPSPEIVNTFGLDSDFDSFQSGVELLAGDEIVFYRPSFPKHHRHFLVRILKRMA